MGRTSVTLAVLIVLIKISICANAASASENDACRKQLPLSLIAAISQTFPGLRAPLETDNLQEDVAYNRAHGGNGCISVAIANFDGINSVEYLIGLSTLKSETGLVIIARENAGKWRFQKLEGWPSDRNRLYVDVARPGKYVRTDALDSRLATDERFVLQCQHPGAVIGETESNVTVYCLISGRWLYVQTED